MSLLWDRHLIYSYRKRLYKSRKAKIVTSTILAFLLFLLDYHNRYYDYITTADIST